MSGCLALRNLTSGAEMSTTSSFLAAPPLPPMATPSTCIMAQRIRALLSPPAVCALFSSGSENTNHEASKIRVGLYQLFDDCHVYVIQITGHLIREGESSNADCWE